MINLIQIRGLLSDEEIEWLVSESNNFETDYFQIYNTQTINENSLLDFRKNIEKYVSINFKESNYEIRKIWINRVMDTDTKMDLFHQDTSDLTIVTYFRTDFEGGCFEYYNEDGNKILISPEINLSLVMNNKIIHRITKVTSGKRYSLVSFFGKIKKDKKTLL